MSLTTRLRRAGKKAASVVLAAATAMSMATVGAGVASAANRDWLRPDATGTCEWDGAGYWVQRCDVYSPSMQRNIPVLVQPSQRGGDAGFYLLDGMRAEDHQTGWVLFSDAPATYADSNINLIMPIGGAGSFYSDWVAPPALGSADNRLYMWETFLTSELPAYLQTNFGVNPHRNSIAGLSMGGTAALNLASRHPHMFQQALSFSGYLHTTMPGYYTLSRMAMLSAGGFNINSQFGSYFNPERFAQDPFWNMGGLRGKDIYVSAATGLWGPGDVNMSLWNLTVGWMLESAARTSTVMWEMKARAEGLNPTVDYPPSGVHNWPLWTDQLHRTKGRVLDVMGAW